MPWSGGELCDYDPQKIALERRNFLGEHLLIAKNANRVGFWDSGKDKSLRVGQMADRELVKSIVKSAGILRCISEGRNRLGDIARNEKLSKSTIHRLLRTMVVTGFVVQDPLSLQYFLGPGILELLSNVTIAHEALTLCAMKEMQRLRAFTRETILLHVRVGLQRVCIEEVESQENLKYVNGKGFVAPLYTGAAGKILLSELTDGEIAFFLEVMDLVAVTDRTITDKEKLFFEIKEARGRGYATSFGERAEGSSCISVPVKNYSIPVALSVLGPDNRFTVDRIRESLDEVKGSAKRISASLIGIRENTWKGNRACVD